MPETRIEWGARLADVDMLRMNEEDARRVVAWHRNPENHSRFADEVQLIRRKVTIGDWQVVEDA